MGVPGPGHVVNSAGDTTSKNRNADPSGLETRPRVIEAPSFLARAVVALDEPTARVSPLSVNDRTKAGSNPTEWTQ